MNHLIHYIQNSRSKYQYFFLIAQVITLSCAVVLFFNTFWSATLLLPLSFGIEILAKFLITHIIEHFVHHHHHIKISMLQK